MRSKSDILEGLTEAQREAVTHRDGPLLVLAGPGSGKTRVVTHRIAYLLDQGIPDRHIVGLTFTNKAADEMKQRLSLLRPGHSVWVGTFHRFCASLLRRYPDLVGLSSNFTIYDAQDSQQVLKNTVEQRGMALEYTSLDAIHNEISRAKSRLATPEVYAQGGYGANRALQDIVVEVYPAYQRALRAANAVDFDDLLLYTAMTLHASPELRALLDERYRYLLVDEYQDTNLAQYAILTALAQDHPHLAATGDPDQSIYGWRGANLGNILDFERDYPGARVVRLEQNYRSTQRIVRVADHLIAHNVRRKQKRMFTENPLGAPVRLAVFQSEEDEARQLASDIAQAIRSGRRLSDVAIFYRVNALSRVYEQALQERAIPYQIVHGIEFFRRKEVKDCLAYLQLINNPRDDVALRRIINFPPRKIGKTTLRRLADYAYERNMPLLDAARQAGLVSTISKQAAVHIARFVALIDRLMLVAHQPVEEILGQVLSETGLREYLQASGDPEDERLANVEELLSGARQHDSQQHGDENYLESFLERVALVNDTDDFESQSERVTLMSLHSAKGLEFPIVYIVAVEQRLLPHERSRNDPAGIEEERRLLFVGITRAREALQLSFARNRNFRGTHTLRTPSEFLMELPLEEIEVLDYSDSGRRRPMWDQTPAAERFGGPGDSADDDWSSAEEALPSADASSTAAGVVRFVGPSPLTTAAALAGMAPKQARDDELSPERFRLGMAVVHPEYGLGKIVALSGQDERRTATVNFATGAGQRKFVIARSPLRPAGDADATPVSDSPHSGSRGSRGRD